MNATTTTAGGTVVFEPSKKQYDEFLERRVQAALGMSVDEFRNAYGAGQLDDADAAVSEIIALLGIGQNGN